MKAKRGKGGRFGDRNRDNVWGTEYRLSHKARGVSAQILGVGCELQNAGREGGQETNQFHIT